MKEITIEAKLDNLDVVKQFVNAELEKVPCAEESIMQIDLAVEELFVNIANYAYNQKIGFAKVLVEVLYDPTRVEITLMDNGVPYDPLAHEDPDLELSLEERPIGGLGIFMVKESMDLVSYQFLDGKNILTIQKSLATDG